MQPPVLPAEPARSEFPKRKSRGGDAVKVLDIVRIVLASHNLPLCKHPHGTAFGFAGVESRLVSGEHDGQAMELGSQGGAMAPRMVGHRSMSPFPLPTLRARELASKHCGVPGPRNGDPHAPEPQKWGRPDLLPVRDQGCNGQALTRSSRH